MQGNKSKKHNLLDTRELLFCLLAFSLLGILLPTTLSSEVPSRLIGSMGAIAYSPKATLLVTDSTPEGSVPYKMDGNSGYQTGSTYNISAGGHTIELPSPYTSSISNITYYFSQWQDGSTDNPRAVTLEADTTTSLHGLYSTSPEPPPPPPPPSGDYLAYNGFEHGSRTYEENPDGLGLTYVLEDGSYTEVVTSFVDNGETHYPISGSYALKQVSYARNAPAHRGWGSSEIYMSLWLFFPSTNPTFEFSGDNNYDEFSEMRMNDNSGLWTMIYQTSPWRPEDMYWNFKHGLTSYGYPIGGFNYNVYPTSHSGTVNRGTVVANPHEVPIGRWFKLEYYVKLGDSDGIYKVWITDPENPDPSRQANRVLFSIEGTQTTTGSSPNYWCLPKLYGMRRQINTPKVAYSDEWYIYNYNAHSSESPPPPPPSDTANLLVTDSTPEDPVPFLVDGKSGYQTGTTYSLDVGTHTIELPSPHTSTASGMTYEFSYWDDDPSLTSPTREISLSTSINLHAIYVEASI